LKKELKSTGSTIKKKSRRASQDLQQQKDLAEMYKRVFTRPFLFQSASCRKKESGTAE
jgi:hypothetical protein